MSKWYSLNAIGSTVERIFGRSHVYAAFAASAVSGNIMSYKMSQYPAVGASGAIFGLAGAFANWLPQYYNSQLHIDLQTSGLMTGMPMVVAIVSAILGGVVSIDREAAAFFCPEDAKLDCIPDVHLTVSMSALPGSRCSISTRCITVSCAQMV